MTTQDLTTRVARTPFRLLDWSLGLVRAFVRRRKFKRLQDLDDHILDDIGVTRADIAVATRLPFTHDPATELRRLADDRRRRLGRGIGR